MLKLQDVHTWDTVPLPCLNEEPRDVDHFLDVAGPHSGVYDSNDAFTSAMLSLRLQLRQGE